LLLDPTRDPAATTAELSSDLAPARWGGLPFERVVAQPRRNAVGTCTANGAAIKEPAPPPFLASQLAGSGLGSGLELGLI
jgi:hypothetical protein